MKVKTLLRDSNETNITNLQKFSADMGDIFEFVPQYQYGEGDEFCPAHWEDAKGNDVSPDLTLPCLHGDTFDTSVMLQVVHTAMVRDLHVPSLLAVWHAAGYKQVDICLYVESGISTPTPPLAPENSDFEELVLPDVLELVA